MSDYFSPDEERFYFLDDEGFEERCRRRLEEEMGINSAGAEVILRLRSRLRAMQTRLRRMEAEMGRQKSIRQNVFNEYRQVYFEASWYEMDEE